MKSVITCDKEGIIKTLSTGAVRLFGYDKEELIDKKRVSIFSPGEIVLQNVATWLKTAEDEGKYETETIFERKNGEKINAWIKITPLYGDGKDKPLTGYCGITKPIEKEVDVPIKFTTKLVKFLAITRMPFLSAVLMPALAGGAFVSAYMAQGSAAFEFNTLYFILTLVGLMLLHLGSNVMNDYFDVKDGTDDANNNYFMQYSGGSRAVELRLITLEGTQKLGLGLILASFVVGVYLAFNVGWMALLIGLTGLFLGYYYTAPPLRLVARKGLGELAITLAFGPLITLGMGFVLTQQLSAETFLLGLPLGLLTANILLINQFPDAEADATTGKNHLVVTYGKEASTWIYLAILTGALISSMFIWNMLMPDNYAFLSVSIASYAAGLAIWRKIRQDYRSRRLVKQNVNTIMLSALTGLAMAGAIWLG